jgi:hypothetical protein
MDSEANRATIVQRDLDSVAAAVHSLTRALGVMVCDHRIRAFLLRNDVKALEQAEKALDMAGFDYPSAYDDVDDAILGGEWLDPDVKHKPDGSVDIVATFLSKPELVEAAVDRLQVVVDALLSKEQTVTTETEHATVPSLEHVLSLLAFHVSSVMTDRPVAGNAVSHTGLGFGGFGDGCPLVHLDCEIQPSVGVDEPWGIWAQVWLAPRGQQLQCCGNRCGGRERLMALYAPVIDWVAAYHRQVRS